MRLTVWIRGVFMKTRLIVAGAVSAVAFLHSPILGHADIVYEEARTEEELREKKEEVQKRIEELEREMTEKEREMERKKREFEETQSKIEKTDEEIQRTEERIEKRKELIGDRLRTLQGSHDVFSYLNVLLGSESFTDLIQRIIAVSRIIDADLNLIEDQKEDFKKLSQQKEALRMYKEELEEQFRILQEEHAELEAKKAEQEALSASIDERLELIRIRNLQRSTALAIKANLDELPVDGESSETALAVIEEASRYLGYPYVWGGASPSTSFDCSGLVQWSFAQAGITLPRTAAQQYLATERIGIGELMPGDLVFFSYGKGIAHVGIYIGNGKMINAQNSGVKIDPLEGYWEQYIAGFGRAIDHGKEVAEQTTE